MLYMPLKFQLLQADIKYLCYNNSKIFYKEGFNRLNKEDTLSKNICNLLF
jgi:hypothetical protein